MTLLLALLLLLGVSVAWAGRIPSPVEDAGRVGRALPVETARPEPVDGFVRRREYTGEVRARRTSALGFDRAARLLTLHVTDGSRVRRDQPLAVLDTRALDAERARLTARRAEAQALLEEMRAGPRREVVAAAREAAADLAAQVALLERMESRRRELRAEELISDEEFDEISSRLSSARARLRGAKDRVEELEEGTREERIVAQEARVAQLDAAIARLDVDVEDSTLKAPFAGHVLRHHVDEGTVVTPGQPVLTLVEDVSLEAWVGVPPRVAMTLEPGTTYRVLVEDRAFDATLRARLPGTDAATRTQMLVLDLPADAASSAVPGQVARLGVEERVAEAGLWVPTSALTRGVRGLWAVYALETSEPDRAAHAVRHPVEVLHAEQGRALVRGTLSAASRVVVGNAERIAPGQLVAAVGTGN